MLSGIGISLTEITIQIDCFCIFPALLPLSTRSFLLLLLLLPVRILSSPIYPPYPPPLLLLLSFLFRSSTQHRVADSSVLSLPVSPSNFSTGGLCARAFCEACASQPIFIQSSDRVDRTLHVSLSKIGPISGIESIKNFMVDRPQEGESMKVTGSLYHSPHYGRLTNRPPSSLK